MPDHHGRRRPPSDLDRTARRLAGASASDRPLADLLDWDDPRYDVDPGDPRWRVPSWDPLATSPSYLDADRDQQTAVGLRRTVALLADGIAFEEALVAGLRGFCHGRDVDDPIVRYVHHEIREEERHTEMFRRVVKRTGVVPARRTVTEEAALARLAASGTTTPPLLFLAALAGEEALDHGQRLTVRDAAAHPLLRAVCRLHVVDEARHLSFARAYLRHVVPRMDDRRRRALAHQAPLVVAWTVDHLTRPAAGPPAELEATRDGAVAPFRRAAGHRAFRLCVELELVDRRLLRTWVRRGLVPA